MLNAWDVCNVNISLASSSFQCKQTNLWQAGTRAQCASLRWFYIENDGEELASLSGCGTSAHFGLVCWNNWDKASVKEDETDKREKCSRSRLVQTRKTEKATWRLGAIYGSEEMRGWRGWHDTTAREGERGYTGYVLAGIVSQWSTSFVSCWLCWWDTI